MDLVMETERGQTQNTFLFATYLATNLGTVADYSALMTLCNETAVLHIGLQEKDVHRINIFVNATEIGDWQLKGQWMNSVTSNFKNRLKLDTSDGFSITLGSMSTADAGNYRCLITYVSGTYTERDWQIMFHYDKTQGSGISIKQRKKITEAETNPGARSEAKNGYIVEELLCKHATVACISLDDAFKCMQEAASTNNAKQYSNLSVVGSTMSATISSLILLSVIPVCYMAIKRHKRKPNHGDDISRVNKEVHDPGEAVPLSTQANNEDSEDTRRNEERNAHHMICVEYNTNCTLFAA